MRLPGLASILALVLGATSSHASTLVHFDTAQLTQASDQIVIGKVESVRSYWGTGRRTILTDAVVRVNDTLKGEVAATVVITQLGGEVDGVKVAVAGCPAFQAGEEAVLFLAHGRSDQIQLTGLAQGKFEIETDPGTGARLVQRRTPGFAIREARALGRADIAPPRRGAAVPLQSLLDEIHDALVAERAR